MELFEKKKKMDRLKALESQNELARELTSIINQTNDLVKIKNFNSAYKSINKALDLIIGNPILDRYMDPVSKLRNDIVNNMSKVGFGFRRSSKRSKSPKRRGRPKGSKNKKRKSSKSKAKSRRKRGRPKGSKNKKSR